MPKAYSYLRFSTPEQGKGDSSRRQTDKAQAYAQKHGLDLDNKLTFADEGVSAFRGKNLEDGELGAFLTAVQFGKVEPGSYLLVESLDRLSRQSAWLAIGTLTSILAHGIRLVTLNDEKLYSRETMTAHQMDLMYAVMGFIRAHEESEHKSFRLKAVWAQKRATVAQRPMTSIAPAWLRLDKQTGTFQEIPECVAVVRRIFREYLAGRGAARIVTALNQENVPVFSLKTRKGSRRGKQWHVSYVRRILENPAVIGTHTVYTVEHDGRKKTRHKAGDPIPNYFPAIIDEDTFKRAQALRLDTPSPLRGRNANREEVKNLFGGLGKCGRCGSRLVYLSKGKNKAGRTYIYLLCSKARYGAGCKYTLVPYERVESAFLEHAPRVLATAPGDFDNTELHEEIRQVENNLEGIGYQLSDLAEAYAQTKLQTLFAKMKALEDDQKELRKQRDDLHHRAGIVEDRSVTKRIQDLEEALQADSLDRRKVNVLMRMVFSEVTVNPDTCSVDVTWKNGIQGESLLYWFPEDTAKAA